MHCTVTGSVYLTPRTKIKLSMVNDITLCRCPRLSAGGHFWTARQEGKAGKLHKVKVDIYPIMTGSPISDASLIIAFGSAAVLFCDMQLKGGAATGLVFIVLNRRTSKVTLIPLWYGGGVWWNPTWAFREAFSLTRKPVMCCTRWSIYYGLRRCWGPVTSFWIFGLQDYHVCS